MGSDAGEGLRKWTGKGDGGGGGGRGDIGGLAKGDGGGGGRGRGKDGDEVKEMRGGGGGGGEGGGEEELLLSEREVTRLDRLSNMKTSLDTGGHGEQVKVRSEETQRVTESERSPKLLSTLRLLQALLNTTR